MVAYKDGAGSASFKAFRFTASGTTSAFAVLPVSPVSGDRYPSTGVTMVVNASSTPAQNLDVQWNVATDAVFSNVVFSTSSLNKVNGEQGMQVSGLTSGTRYYWRARAAPAGTTTWGPWSTVWSFIPDLNSGNAFGYVESNVGYEPAVDRDVTATGQVESNVGFEVILDRDVTSFLYVDLNVGAEITRKGDAVQYVEEGDVDTSTPTPHLWFLRPASGRAGDGLEIYCFGVGDLAVTYGGVVEAYYGPSRGWVAVPTTGWQTFPPTANAYTEARVLDEVNNIIDMQHTVVAVTVPLDALPPGMPLRIRTEGP